MNKRFRADGGADVLTREPQTGTAATAGPPVLIVDSTQRCVEANDAASQMLGMSRAQIVGQSVDSLKLPEGHLLVLPRIEDEQAAGGWAAKTELDDPPRGRRPSRREREILALLALGSTDVQIAEELGLSPATVQTHVRNAKSKLGARTRAQAVALALVSGLIALD